MTTNKLQNDLWQPSDNRAKIAELCNVLYERELNRLSQEQSLSKEALQRTMRSLPYYIQKAAYHILNTDTPLELDESNASWLAKQTTVPFSVKADKDKTSEFYQKHARVPLIVPVSVDVFGIEHLVLDSIDEVDELNQRIHCNQNGWFNFDGRAQEDSQNTHKQLLKPTKAVMSAAVCGHQWKNQHRMASRALALRELLLATQVNWKKLSQPLPVKSKTGKNIR